MRMTKRNMPCKNNLDWNCATIYLHIVHNTFKIFIFNSHSITYFRITRITNDIDIKYLPILACTNIFITITHRFFYLFQMDMTNMTPPCQQVWIISVYISLNLKTSTFSKPLMDLKKWGGMYDSYETFTNVSERLRISSENIPHILRIPYYGPRVHEKYRKPVSFNR